MKFNVTVDRDEDGMWIVDCPAIPGCVSQGQTKDEALVNIQEAIQLCLEVRAERGLPQKAEEEVSRKEGRGWTVLSLSVATHGMEQKDRPRYTAADLKEVF